MKAFLTFFVSLATLQLGAQNDSTRLVNSVTAGAGIVFARQQFAGFDIGSTLIRRNMPGAGMEISHTAGLGCDYALNRKNKDFFRLYYQFDFASAPPYIFMAPMSFRIDMLTDNKFSMAAIRPSLGLSFAPLPFKSYENLKLDMLYGYTFSPDYPGHAFIMRLKYTAGS